MRLFDFHCDTLYECYETGQHLRKNALAIDARKAQGLQNYAQFFALFCGARAPEPADNPPHLPRRCLLDLPPEQRLQALLQTAKQEFRQNADWLTQCYDSEDFRTAQAKGKAAAFLTIEGAELLCTEEQLIQAYDAGVRAITLSWNGQNQYACGAATDNDAGLSSRGHALVQTLVQMGIIIDVSHLSERGFWEVCMDTEAPFAATHSNSRAICPHLRNLTDLQFLELVRRGGIAGINLYTEFLTGSTQAGIQDILKHIEHFCALGGEACLAVGADFDGCSTLPQGIASLADMNKLAESMLRHNYLESTVDRIFYGNLAAFIDRML